VPRQISAQVNQVGPTTGEGVARDHRVVIDRPVEKGGNNRGPLGGELFLFSLGGCFLSTLLAAARTRSEEVADVRIDLAGIVDGSPESFTGIDMKLTGKFSSLDVMKKLVDIAERGCLVTNTLRRALTISIVLEREDL
jgi:putative redox protein